jgi:MFS family permease
MSIWYQQNFMLLLFGRLITNIGDSLYFIAAAWLVFDITGDPFFSGLASFLTLLPKNLQFLAGPFIDRWPPAKTMRITQLLQCILVVIIPVLDLFELLTAGAVLIIMPLLAMLDQIMYPAQEKALPLTVLPHQLVQGNSLFALAHQGTDILFTALSGILISIFGAVFLYWIDAFSFLIAFILFSSLQLPGKSAAQHREPRTGYASDLKQGFYIIFRSKFWIMLIGALTVNGTIGIMYAVLPAFADAFQGPKFYGFLLTAVSAGVLVGALAAPLCARLPLGKIYACGFLLSSLCWLLAMQLPPVAFAVLFGIAWLPVGLSNVLFASVIQSAVPNYILGRTRAAISSIVTLFMPAGALAGGILASWTSPYWILFSTGFGFFILGGFWLFHPFLYRLPPVPAITADTFRLPLDKDQQL